MSQIVIQVTNQSQPGRGRSRCQRSAVNECYTRRDDDDEDDDVYECNKLCTYFVVCCRF